MGIPAAYPDAPYDRLFAAAEARELSRQLELLDLLATRASTPELRAELASAYLELLQYAAKVVGRMARTAPAPPVLQ